MARRDRPVGVVSRLVIVLRQVNNVPDLLHGDSKIDIAGGGKDGIRSQDPKSVVVGSSGDKVV